MGSTNLSCIECRKRIHGNSIRIQCIGCKKWVHGACSKMPVSSKKAVTCLSTPFICRDCNNPENLSKSMVFPPDEKDRQHACPLTARQNLNKDGGTQCCAHCLDLRSEVENLKKLVTQLRDSFTQVEKNVNFWDAKLEEKSKALDVRLSAANKACAIISQQHLDVVIPNIPEVTNENVMKISKCVLENLVPDIIDSDITNAKRFKPSERGPGLLKVTLSNPQRKKQVLSASRTKKMKIKDLCLREKFANYSGSPATWGSPTQAESMMHKGLFVRESLTKSVRDLLSKALALKRNKVIHSAWTSTGKLFVRHHEDDAPTCVTSLKDLPELTEVSKTNQYSTLSPNKRTLADIVNGTKASIFSSTTSTSTGPGIRDYVPILSPVLDRTVVIMEDENPMNVAIISDCE